MKINGVLKFVFKIILVFVLLYEVIMWSWIYFVFLLIYLMIN